MFKNINEYIKNSQDTRQEHIKLDMECVMIGTTSTQCRGLLAHYLGTTVPRGHKIQLCHACHNPKCSNPQHLYWGTVSENIQDSINNGTYINPWDRLVEKHGLEDARKIHAQRLKGRSGVGGQNKLTSEQIDNYIQAINQADRNKYGWISRTARIMNVSHSQVRRIIKKYDL